MVKGIKNILVPIDGSKNSYRGLDKAISIAKDDSTTITVIYVFHLPWQAGIKLTKNMKKESSAKATRAVGIAKGLVEKNGIPFKWKSTAGNTGNAIVKTAKAIRADMIVIGARGIGAVKEKFLGSTSNHVLHKAKMPVLVVK
jgi:nucleotide-binding universal stress UspA family protein